MSGLEVAPRIVGRRFAAPYKIAHGLMSRVSCPHPNQLAGRVQPGQRDRVASVRLDPLAPAQPANMASRLHPCSAIVLPQFCGIVFSGNVTNNPLRSGVRARELTKGLESMNNVLAERSSWSLWPHEAGVTALADHEMLEVVLGRAVPRNDVTRLAKEVIERFGSFADAIAAAPQRLTEVDGMTSGAIAEFKFVEATVQRFTKGVARKRMPMGSWSEVADYCRASMAFEPREVFRVLFLDRRNGLIADEVQGVGTVDHAPIYPREVIRRALELSAAAIILAHNHPSGDPTPSAQDVKMTLDIIAIAEPMGITVHDHIIVGRAGNASLKGKGLI